MTASKTLRDLTGMDNAPAKVADSALILIDCQNTYREGVMQLEGVEEALAECRKLLDRYREAGRPVIHIQHDAGAGSPYDPTTELGSIADVVAPREGEPVVVKQYPSAFQKTGLDEILKKHGVKDVVLAGFMTHMCVSSTGRAAFNHGYRPTIVDAATATRALAAPNGQTISARTLHDASLTSLQDLFAVVTPKADDVR